MTPFSKKSVSLAEKVDKVKRCLRAKELGKKYYGIADALLDELSAEVEVGGEIKLSARKKVVLEDQYQTKTIVWKPCGIRRYELKVINS
jgi:hypothetical protein